MRCFADLWAVLHLQNTPFNLSVSAIMCVCIFKFTSLLLLALTKLDFSQLFNHTDSK